MQELTTKNAATAAPLAESENQRVVTGHVQRGRADRSVTVMAASGVTLLTCLAWVLSYTALRQLALSAGMATWAAIFWPLWVDLFVFVATLAAISDRRRGRSTAYAWAKVPFTWATIRIANQWACGWAGNRAIDSQRRLTRFLSRPHRQRSPHGRAREQHFGGFRALRDQQGYEINQQVRCQENKEQ